MQKLTIITSAYNAEKYLKECAKSVLSQSFSAFQWILIDDGSTDNTAEIIKQLAAEDARITPIFQENKGLAASRNVALDQVSTEYFMFLDADDVLLPEALTVMVSAIEKTNVDFVSFDYRDFQKREDLDHIPVSKTPHNLKQIDDPWAMLEKGCGVDRNNWNKIYQTSIFGDIRFVPEISQSQDIVYGWRIRQKMGKIATISNPLIGYRRSNDSVSKKGVTEKYLKAIHQVAFTVIEDFQNAPENQKIFAEKEVSKLIYKVYVVKGSKLKDSVRQSLAQTLLQDLWQKNIFQPQKLSLSKSLSFYLLHPVSLNSMKIFVLGYLHPKRMVRRKYRHNHYDWEKSKKDYKFFQKYFSQTLSIDETLKKLAQGYSISRFGDGEYDCILGKGIGYQKATPKLKQRMVEVINSQAPKHLVAIVPPSNVDIDAFKSYGDTRFFVQYFIAKGFKMLSVFPKREYANAGVFRMAFDTKSSLTDYGAKTLGFIEKIKSIWEGKSVVVVTGVNSVFDFDERLFGGVKDHKKILGKTKNAFSDYDALLSKCLQEDKDKLFLISLGPCATILAYDLAMHGYRAIDMGHITNCYHEYLGEKDSPEKERSAKK